MSHSVEWIEPIYNRVYSDVLEAEENRNLVNPIGAYNAIDLNRIENNTKYVMEDMLERKIIRVPPAMAIKTNWEMNDIPTRDDMNRIVKNVQLLMSLSNPIIEEDFHIIYESTQFTYSLANAIEYDLDLMKNQPELPVKKWLLKVVNGIIVETGTSSEYLEEEQIVHIKAVPYGENAKYMHFENWSGNTDDLQYVGNVNNEETTFQMQFHDYEDYSVELTANFKVRIPRTLTLHGGTIYDDIGGSTRQYFAGDEVLILADVASPGKRFYEWTGTEEGLDNITGGPEPSTSWIVMPDCDVELTSFYINAGQHSVKVDGTIQGWYDYDDYVSISPGSRDKYVFLYWSGDTGYLEDVTSSSFKMPDVNVVFYSNWKYVPDQYQLVVNNGNGSGVYDDNAIVPISAIAPSSDVGFVEWAKDEGRGSFGNEYSQNTYFYMSTGNAVITAKFAPGHKVVMNNINNSGNAKTDTVVEGEYYVVDTAQLVGNDIFYYWLENGEEIGPRFFTIEMGSEDRVFTAVYRPRKTFKLTVNNGTGSGNYLERSTVAISANPAPSGKRFAYWNTSSDIDSIDNRYSASTTVVTGYGDCSVTAVYENIPTTTYHNVTVNNGSGSGRYAEGDLVTCTGDKAPVGYEFSHWLENGNIISYGNPYRFWMGKTDKTLTAVYKEVPYFTVTVENGKLANGSTTGTFPRNSNPQIIMNPAPEGMKFLQWEVLEPTTGTNVVTQPLSENTTIRNLTSNVRVRATYYVPDPEIQYTLTITGKDGEITTSNHPIGEQVEINADSPDEGYKFYKWVGDTQYVNDRYSEKAVVNMPGKNIELQMEYRREGYTTTYHVELNGGLLLVETDPDTGEEKWDIEGEFEERAVVRIKAVDIPLGWKFNGWKNNEDDGKSISTVNDLSKEETFLTVEDFDILLTRDVIERNKYSMTIVNGETSGSYHESDPVTVFFNLEDTETTHYLFTRWSGDTSYLKLFESGKPFDITKPGSADKPQIIKMPTRNIKITAIYTTNYRLKVNNGTINGETEKFYAANTKVNVSANEPTEGKRFSHWIGNVEYVDNKFNPNIVVTIPNGGIELTAVYVDRNNQNDVGLSNSSLYSITSIDSTDIEIVAGNLEVGLLIIDVKGHIYIVTKIEDTTLSILRLTKIQGGNKDGQ